MSRTDEEYVVEFERLADTAEKAEGPEFNRLMREAGDLLREAQSRNGRMPPPPRWLNHEWRN